MSLKSRLGKVEEKAQQKPIWQWETENLYRIGKVALDDVIDTFGTESFSIWPLWFPSVSEEQQARARKADKRIEIETREFEQKVIEHCGGVERYNRLNDQLFNYEITSEQWRDAIKFW